MLLSEAKEILENEGYLVEFTTEDIKKTYREYIENESTKMTWEEFGKLAFKALTANQIGLLLHGEIPNIKENPFDSSKLRYLRK